MLSKDEKTILKELTSHALRINKPNIKLNRQLTEEEEYPLGWDFVNRLIDNYPKINVYKILSLLADKGLINLELVDAYPDDISQEYVDKHFFPQDGVYKRCKSITINHSGSAWELKLKQWRIYQIVLAILIPLATSIIGTVISSLIVNCITN